MDGPKQQAKETIKGCRWFFSEYRINTYRTVLQKEVQLLGQMLWPVMCFNYSKVL